MRLTTLAAAEGAPRALLRDLRHHLDQFDMAAIPAILGEADDEHV
jgi:hypothetical protein